MIPPSWSGRSAGTGALRTRCIGCWTSPSARMTAGCATGQRRATWPSFARSLSTWSPETGAPKPAYGAGARRLLGTTATCSRSSHTKLMREPWADGGDWRAVLFILSALGREREYGQGKGDSEDGPPGGVQIDTVLLVAIPMGGYIGPDGLIQTMEQAR